MTHAEGEAVDPSVLQEMQRVLTSTTFLTAEDLVARGGVVDFDVPASRAGADRVEITELPGERMPLPRRR
jgi:hypothetical protein